MPRYVMEDAAPRYVFEDAPSPKALDYVGAAASGVNRGALVNAAGLPVDTIANIVDLAIAGYGRVKGAFGGEPPALLDRSKYVGTSSWIDKKLQRTPIAAGINNPIPDSTAGRILHGAGQAAGSSIGYGGGSALREAGNMAMGGLSGAAGTIAAEAGGSNTAAILASMAPQAAALLGPAAVRGVVRGGEQGRRAMAQRIQDFEGAGVDAPSVGLASGNRFVQGAENLLANTPGAVGVMSNARERIVGGMDSRTAALRDQTSPVYGPEVAGRAIQGGITDGFKNRFQNTYGALADQTASFIPGGMRFPTPTTEGALRNVTAVNPQAPDTTALFVQPRLGELRGAVQSDTTRMQPGIYYPERVSVGLPFSALKEIRTGIGREAASNAIIGTPEQADFKRVYGGLSQDMRGAADTADRAAAGAPIGPLMPQQERATRALDRSNRYYSAGMQRIDRLQPFANKQAPEQAYSGLESAARENSSTVQSVMRSLNPEQRQAVSATAIDRLGRATPGAQNDAGTVWSPERFLTNWNKMTPQSKSQLFPETSQDLNAIARAASMMRDSSKIWANPSGTAASSLARGAIGATAFGAFFNPAMAAAAAGGMGAANVTARALTHGPFVRWLAESTRISGSRAMSHLQRLGTTASQSGDEQFKSDVGDYIRALTGEGN